MLNDLLRYLVELIAANDSTISSFIKVFVLSVPELLPRGHDVSHVISTLFCTPGLDCT